MHSASILFFLFYITWKFIFIKASSPCISATGRFKFCEPDFINVAQNATVNSTSTCGQGSFPEQVCRYISHGGELVEKCFECHDRNLKMARRINLAIDHHIQDNETCWVSALIPQTDTIQAINITITLKKLHEVYYVIIEFCEELPDSMILYKSSDHGKTWIPWNFFSYSCHKAFNMKRSKPMQIIHQNKFNEIEPACFSFKQSIQNISSNFKVLPFNPLTGRNSLSYDMRTIKDWVSLTDIKISLILDASRKRKKTMPTHLSISDITIGGRGQCYGHSNSLIIKNNTIVCDCTHGTTGQDCSQCLPTHNDQPWKMILVSDSNEKGCERCFCNNHAEECEFDRKIYENTSRKHGSRCLNCLHYTTGPHCDSCSPGYYRNRAFPINHPQVCQKCSCHPIGSILQSHCDPDNGNCRCKNGVEGKLCNRCMKGYQQTKSSITPCVPDSKKDIMATEERCGTCGKNRPRIKFRKFCKKHLMIKISILSKEVHGDWTRFGVKVMKIWKIQQSLRSQVNLYESEDSIYPIWVENADIRCQCPNFKLGQTYLLLTKIKQKIYSTQPELIVDRKSSALDWSDDWDRRLNMFKKRDQQGRCNRFQYRRKHSRLRSN